MRTRIIVVIGTMLTVAVTAPAQEPPTVDVVAANAPGAVDPNTPAAPATQPAQTWSSFDSGVFSSDYLRLNIPNKPAGDAITGTITRGRHNFAFQGKRDSDTGMSGTFKDEFGNAYPFTAKLEPDHQMTVQTGQTTYTLTDEAQIIQQQQQRARGFGYGGGFMMRSRVGARIYPDADGRGAIIDIMRPEGSAARAGLQSGDRIVQIDGQDVTNLTADQVRRAISDAEPGTTVKIGVLRGDNTQLQQFNVTRERPFQGFGGGGGGGGYGRPPQGRMNWVPDDNKGQPSSAPTDDPPPPAPGQ
jgi:hypothetical protein